MALEFLDKLPEEKEEAPPPGEQTTSGPAQPQAAAPALQAPAGVPSPGDTGPDFLRVLPADTLPTEDNYWRTTKTTPDEAAKVIGLTDKLQAPHKFVETNLKELSTAAEAPPATYWSDIKNNSPKTHDFLTDNDNMAVARDDIHTLIGNEKAVKDFSFKDALWETLQVPMRILKAPGDLGEKIASKPIVQDMTRAAAAGVLRMGATATRVPSALYDLSNIRNNLILKAMGRPELQMTAPEAIQFKQEGKWWDDKAQQVAPVGLDNDIYKQWQNGDREGAVRTMALQVAANMPNQLLLLGATAGGAGMPALVAMGMQQAADTAYQNREKGYDPAMSGVDSLFEGFFEGAWESVGTGPLMKSWANALAKSVGRDSAMKIVKDGFKHLVQTTLGEVFEEMGTQATQDLSAYLTVNKDALKGVWGRMVNAGVIAAGSSVSMTSPTAIGLGAIRGLEMRRATQGRDFYNKFGDSAKASAFRQRAPERFKQNVETNAFGTAAENVAIDPEVFKTYFQSKGIDPEGLANELGIANDYKESQDSGRDLQIPFSTWVDKLVDTEHYKALADDIKFRSGDPSHRQARAAREKAVAEVKAENEAHTKKVMEAGQDPAWKAHKDSAFNTMYQQLVEAGQTEDLARAGAELYSSNQVAEAKGQGLTPDQVDFSQPQWRVKVVRDQSPAQVAQQMTQSADLERLLARRAELEAQPASNEEATQELVGLNAEIDQLTKAAGTSMQQFAGQNAQTADPLQFENAQILEGAGKDAETIRRATGWFKGDDKKWRFEIQDKDAKFTTSLDELSVFDEYRLEDVLDHPNLFRAYPQLRNFRLIYRPDYMGASVGTSQGTRGYVERIVLGGSTWDSEAKAPRRRTKEETLESLLHEVQHLIQDSEGFASGTMPTMKHTPELEMKQQAVRDYEHAINERWPGVLEDRADITDLEGYIRAQQELEKRKREADAVYKRLADEGFETYRSFSGEIEARDTAARRELTDEERKLQKPDLRGKDAIIYFRDTKFRYDPTGTVAMPKRAADAQGPTKIPTDTKEFKEWFRDSKIVDEQGKPLVVYHGTPKGGFKKFKRGVSFFTVDPESAGIHAERPLEPERIVNEAVVPAYLSIQNPFIVGEFDDEISLLHRKPWRVEELKKQGYDGAMDSSMREIVVFSPEQIKSTFNRGTFNPNDPRILFQDALPAPYVNPFYSQLERTIEKKMGTRAKASELKAMIASAGLKTEEIQTSGIYEWLDAHDRVVTKQDVMDFLRANALNVEEKRHANRGIVERDDEDIPREVEQKADELRNEAADRAMEEWSWDYDSDTFGVREIKVEQPDDVGQKDLFGTVIEKRPNKHYIEVDGEIVKYDELGEWSKKHAKEETIQDSEGDDVEGVAVWTDEGYAQDAFYSQSESHEQSDRDYAYDEWMREHPIEEYYEEARQELGMYENEEEDEDGESAPDAEGITGRPKWSSYQTPGGEDYQELIFTLPPRSKPYVSESTPLPGGGWRVFLSDGATREYPNVESQEAAERLAAASGSEIGRFNAPTHWPYDNPFAHTRYKAVILPSGKRALLLEELQSDWHQKARERRKALIEDIEDDTTLQPDQKAAIIKSISAEIGYKKELTAYEQKQIETLKAEAADIQAKIDATDGRAQLDALGDQLEKVERKIESIKDRIDESVPNVPFKKTWHEYVMKRMIRWAADHGFEALAWTAGPIQVDRWSNELRRRVDEFKWMVLEGALPQVEVTAFKDGERVAGFIVPVRGRGETHGVKAKLENIVGAKIADEIRRSIGNGDKTGLVNKGDLAIGGDEFGTFYDEILPRFMNHFTGKWGGKVHVEPLDTPQGNYRFETATGEIFTEGKFPSLQEAKDFARYQAEHDSFSPYKGATVTEIKPPQAKYPAHVVDITPEMKRQAQEVGFTLFQRRLRQPVYYSQLQRVIETKLPNVAPVEQLRNILAGQDIKREEVEWSGLPEWLEGQEGKVTKAQVLEVMAANVIELETEIKGGPRAVANMASPYALPEVIAAAEQAGDTEGDLLLTIENDGAAYRALTKKFPELAEDEQWAEKVVESVFGTNTKETRHDERVLPGGTNYRELLIRLPSQTSKKLVKLIDQVKALEKERDALAPTKDTDDATWARWKEIHEEIRRLKDSQPSSWEVEKENFVVPGHWHESRVLAWARVNDRIDADGKKVLFVEEIQSDWHQKGRKKGYVKKGRMSPSELDALRSDAAFVLKKNGLLGFDNVSEALRAVREHDDYATRWDLEKQLDDITLLDKWRKADLKYGNLFDAVPDAPFKDTQAWTGLTVKNILHYAAENGYDRVAWTTGDQQAKRNSAELFADEIRYRELNNGKYWISFWREGTNLDAAERFGVSLNDIAALAGQGVADQIKAKTGTQLEDETRKKLAVRGKAVDFVQKGPHTWYTKYADGSEMGTWLSKADAQGDAARLEEMLNEGPQLSIKGEQISAGGAGFREFYDRVIPSVVEKVGKPWKVSVQNTVVLPESAKGIMEGMTPEERDAYIRDISTRGGVHAAHAIDITDEMKKSLPARPFSQFQADEGEHLAFTTFGADYETWVSILKSANESSFAHEAAHIMLQRRFEFVRSGQASPKYLGQWKVLADWLGVSEGQTKITEEQHEKFARGFELYLREGNAPTVGLRRVFAQFREWLERIYTDPKMLKVQLSDAVRGVMDRLLASEEEIEQAESKLGKNLRQDLEHLAPEVRERLTEMSQDAHDEAVSQLLAKQMKELTAEHKEMLSLERVDAERQAKKEVDELPEQKALEGIRRATFSSKDGVKVAEQYLNPEGGMSEEDRTSWEMLAELYGYENGQDMAQKLIEAPSYKAEVTVRVNRHMSQFADLRNTDRIKEDALNAIHNDRQEELLAAESAALQTMVDDAQGRAVNRQRRREEASIELAAIKQAAAESILAKPIDQAIQFMPYFTAERNAAVKASKALVDKDYMKAAKFKRQQLVNHALAVESLKARRQVERKERFMLSMQRKDMELFKKEEHFVQAASIMGRFGFPRKDYDPRKRKESLKDWATRMDAETGMVDQPDWLLQDEAYTAPYKKLSVQMFNDVVDSLRNIQRVANAENTTVRIRRGASIDLIAAELSAIADASTPESKQYKPTVEPRALDRARSLAAKYSFNLKKPNTIFYKLDGNKDSGPWHETLSEPVWDSANFESVKMRLLNAGLIELWSPYTRAERVALAKPNYNDDLKVSISKMRLLVMALNLGNDGNREKLFGTRAVGVPETVPWGEPFVMDLLQKNLDRRDWEFVQRTWNFINQLWPEVSAMHKDLSGFTPGKVENRPFDVQLADGTSHHMEGGYFPLKRDPRSSGKAQLAETLESPLYTEQHPGWKAMTKTGHLKSRVEADYPVALEITIINRHLRDVVHDLAFRGTIIDLRRFLNNETIQETLRRNVGPEGFAVVREWVASVAGSSINDHQATAEWEEVVAALRKRSVIATLFLKPAIFLQNFANVFLFPGAVEGFGYKEAFHGFFVRGVMDYAPKLFGNWREAKSMRDFVYSKSSMMQDRKENPDFSFTETQNKLFGKNEPLREFSGWLMGITDEATNLPMWLEAYNRELERSGNETKAIRYADLLIDSAVGTGRKYDQAGITRGTELVKSMAMFYSFWNTEYNRWSKETGKIVAPKDLPRFLGFVASRLIFFNMTSMLLSGGWPKEDENNLAWWLRQLLGYPLSFFPGIRDVVGVAMDQMLGLKTYGYRPSPATSGIETLLRTTQTASRYAKGEGNFTGLLESTSHLAAFAFPYPDYLNNIFWNAYNVMNGDMDPEWRDVYKRRPKRER